MYPWVMMILMALLLTPVEFASPCSHSGRYHRVALQTRIRDAPRASIDCSMRVHDSSYSRGGPHVYTREDRAGARGRSRGLEFNLPSAQGGQLRLSMRTPRGPVVVAFYRPGDEEDVEYFKALAAKRRRSTSPPARWSPSGSPNLPRPSILPASGLKSYVLYDYARVTSRQWGLWEKDRRQGDYARRAVFVVGPDHKVAHAWVGERPEPGRSWRRSARSQASPSLRKKGMGKRAIRRKAPISRRRCRLKKGRR